MRFQKSTQQTAGEVGSSVFWQEDSKFRKQRTDVTDKYVMHEGSNYILFSFLHYRYHVWYSPDNRSYLLRWRWLGELVSLKVGHGCRASRVVGSYFDQAYIVYEADYCSLKSKRESGDQILRQLRWSIKKRQNLRNIQYLLPFQKKIISQYKTVCVDNTWVNVLVNEGQGCKWRPRL